MDFSKLRQGELIAVGGGVALFIFLFLDWFSGIDGWDSLGGDVTGFVVAAAAVSAILLAPLAASGRRVAIGDLPRGYVTAMLGALAVGIILWRLLSVPEGAEVEFGFFLGLAAAIAITVGAALSLREDGFELVVPVSGGPRRSSGSARTATTRRAPAKKRSTAARSSSSRSKPSGARKRSGGGK